MSSRAEAKAKAREQREAAERQEAQAASRKRRLMLLGGVLVAAIAVIAVVVVISQSGTDEPVSAEEGTTQANTLFAGIPQTGNVLGDPDAPVTIEEYVDLQCPFCQRFSQEGLPDIVKEYVKTGQAKIVLQTLTFIGADSERGARVAWSAADQNKMFEFVENFYANQGEENSGYATEAFLKKVAGGVEGLDVQKAIDGRRLRQGLQLHPGVAERCDEGERRLDAVVPRRAVGRHALEDRDADARRSTTSASP